jgi:DNA (cytosine-5)-methyltransferase 1
MKLRHGSLFSGIGGFDLAAQSSGWENVFHCEWNPFAQRVLKHYWPNAESFHDITKSDFSKYEHTIDIISGGFPCQPFSSAGDRRGTDDTRYLWPAMLDVIRSVKPRYIVGENVYGLINWNDGLVFDTVCTDLEAQGYEVRAFLLPAAAVGAIHRRYRIWFVAHRNGTTWENQLYDEWKVPEQFGQMGKCEPIDTTRLESALCGENDGLPRELDGITFSKWREESIKGYGNAIVPQVALQIFNAINEYERTR